MKLSEELVWRGFCAETTIKDPAELDTRENKKFYFGADPSADSMTIGNLAAMMMCACFVRHGYEPTILTGGATGQIGDPKENSERDLKPLEEVEHNKACLKAQFQRVLGSEIDLVDNYDWFKDIKYIDFLRTVGKTYSMTQLLDRQFVQNRIGEGACGISYAEFSYTLMQGYDFLHLYRDRGIALELCGADQAGNCATGVHLIKRLENARADYWSTPLVIDPVTGRKFGKSEGNAIWLASSDNGGGNFTPVFDFYQFWLNQPDASVEYLMKIYTTYDREFVEKVLADHALAPEKRLAQKALARGATSVVHGEAAAAAIENLTALLFDRDADFSTLTSDEIAEFSAYLPTVAKGQNLADILVAAGLADSKKKAREFITQGAVSINGTKVKEDTLINETVLIKRGKNGFVVVK